MESTAGHGGGARDGEGGRWAVAVEVRGQEATEARGIFNFLPS